MRRLPLGVMTGCLVWAQLAAAEDATEELKQLSIGVAPFERVAPPGLAAPQLSPALAAEILAHGTGRTVSPATLSDAAVAEPSDARVRTLAEQHDLDALVVGRVTRLGERVSIDVRLRDGRTGTVAGTYVAELAVDDPAEPVLDHLATQVVAGALALAETSGAVAPLEPTAAAPGRPSTRPPPSGGASLDLGRTGATGPFSIQSDELEATEREGRRVLVFRRNVRVDQGDLELRTQRLEADYPEGAKQPSRLVARDGVEVRQGDRRARCREAEYRSDTQRIVCRGDAVLSENGDELSGESIVFDLADRRVSVEGGTELALASGEAQGSDPAAAPLGGLPGKGPMRISASELEATEEPSGARHVRFEGSVSVEREDLTLRANQIDAFYPPGAREPSELVATGDVQVLQRGREARCDRAVYSSSERRVDCRGNASLRKGDDSVTGESISFDLGAEKLVVSGGTRLVLGPRTAGEHATP